MVDQAAALSAAAYDALRTEITGEVIGPDDADYDRHRSVFNQMVDERPAAIVRCRSRDDVISALESRAQHKLPVAVRCGATSGYSTVAGGIVVDVSPMKAVDVDAKARTVRVGAGLTWAEMDAATQEYGLAVTGARVSGLGVTGVALDGGTGWLERMYGPTCSSLIGAEIVLADGRVERAGELHNPDLLWALRGGGGSLGVVTALEFKLHPVGPTLVAGFLSYSRGRALEVARFYRDYMERAPDEVGGGLLLFSGLAGACTIVFCFVGSIEEGERAAAPLRELGPLLDAVAPNQYRAFQSMGDLQNPYGTRSRLRGDFLRELSDEALEGMVAAANKPAASLSYMMLQPLGGALGRLRANEQALNLPRTSWAYQCVGLWPPVRTLDRGNVTWVDDFCERMRPFALGATFPGLVSAKEGTAKVIASYGPEGYAKLQRLKRLYDPANVFRCCRNIAPGEH